MEYNYKGYKFIYEEFSDDVIIMKKDDKAFPVDGKALVRFVIDCHIRPISEGLLKEVYEDFISRHGHFVNKYV